jgi:hypothetical protein
LQLAQVLDGDIRVARGSCPSGKKLDDCIAQGFGRSFPLAPARGQGHGGMEIWMLQ